MNLYLEAIAEKKWAFAADYVRLYAIYKYGGIWLETDVELFKSFDSVLNCNMFIGKESWSDEEKHIYLTSHFIVLMLLQVILL